MPVDDHPIHPSTQKGKDFRYGCNNHKDRKGAHYYAPNRIYRPDGTYHLVLEKIQTEWINYPVCPAHHEHIGCTDCRHAPIDIHALIGQDIDRQLNEGADKAFIEAMTKEKA